MRRWFESMIDGEGGPAGALARPPLWLASRAYAAIIAMRNARYDRGGDSVPHVSVPVVSIGNITTGGTGKTPMTLHVVERLKALGRRPAVVSRGYAAGDGQADELAFIEHAATDVPCIANADRVAGAKTAIAQHNADVIVLDDGFQHRRIARELDLVLLDATQPFQHAQMLPRGRLREPVTSLERASAVIITRADQVESNVIRRLRDSIKRIAAQVPVLSCVHKASQLRSIAPGMNWEPELMNVSAHLASGIARPRAFEQTAREAGIEIRGHSFFADHHRFSIDDAQTICARAARESANIIVVTEKDAVKLARLDFTWTLPVAVLPVRIDFRDDDATMFDNLLTTMLAAWQ